MHIDRRLYSYRYDSTVPNFTDIGPVCVMDAHCSLCACGAAWIAHNDHREEFRIVPLQSQLGDALMKHYAMDPADPTSWLFLLDGQAYASLEAFMRVGRRLGRIWNILMVFQVLPIRLQDTLYALVARNRYRWFGSGDLCSLPDPEVQKRLMQ